MQSLTNAKNDTFIIISKSDYNLINVKSYEFMVYNYVNFINIFYDKELLALNYSKLNAFILIHCGLYIIYYNVFQYIWSLFFIHFTYSNIPP